MEAMAEKEEHNIQQSTSNAEHPISEKPQNPNTEVAKKKAEREEGETRMEDGPEYEI